MDGKLPARIDRATVERVLQRAAELQAASPTIGEGLTEAEVLAVGAEVGIPAEHLRQALIEQRIREPEVAPTVIDRWIGRAVVTSNRVVHGTQEGIAAAITAWLDRHERLVVQRATTGRLTYEPMDSVAGALRRVGAMFDGTRSKPYLNHAELVGVTITPLESGMCHVNLTAMLSGHRKGALIGGGAIFGVGAAAAVLLALTALPWLAVAPVLPVAASEWILSRWYRGVAARTTVGLERLLDVLERQPTLGAGNAGVRGGDRPGLVRGVGQAVREISDEVRKGFTR